MDAGTRPELAELPGRVSAAACRRYDALPVADRMRLVLDAVAHQGKAWRRRWPAIRQIQAGYRMRRGDDGRPALHPQPCVVFVVPRKRPRRTLGHAECLPTRVMLAAGGTGPALGLPTDVQAEEQWANPTACSGAAVMVHDRLHPAPGTMTCRVHLRGAAPGAGPLALSALHVLSPVTRMGQVAPGTGNLLSPTCPDTGVAIGRSEPYGGVLWPSAYLSFDAQLAAILDPGWFDRAFQGLQLSALRPYVAQRAAFDALAPTTRQMILVPPDHPQQSGRAPLMAQFAGYVGPELTIRYAVPLAGGGATWQQVAHRQLVCLQVEADSPPPRPGDSGSAVLTWWPDGTLALLGMFIASLDNAGRERTAFVLPSWELFDLSNWAQLPVGTVAMTPSL